MVLLAAAVAFVVALVTFVIYLFSVGVSLVASASTIGASLRFIVAGLLLFALGAILGLYGDVIIEETEYFFSDVVYPVYRDYVRPFVNLLRRIYNPLICWWNAINWWFFGIFREALYPTLGECGVLPMMTALGNFVLALTEDLIAGHIATGNFLNIDMDFTNVCNKWIIYWNAWMTLYSCACADLADFLRNTPINPIIPVSVLFSEQWADPQTWCAIGNAVNFAFAILQIIYQLIIAIFQAILFPPGPMPFPRPDFRHAADLLCAAVACAVRSYENAFQRFWDAYVPWTFVFTDWLCIVDTLACILIRTADMLLRLLINIDRAVVYPVDTFWEDVIVQDIAEILNLWAPLTAFPPTVVPKPPDAPVFTVYSYAFDTAQPAKPAPWGGANPVFGKKRFTECLCVFIRRTICDPSDASTACFSQAAQQLLAGIDLCCLTNEALTTAVDLLAGFVEFSLHLAKGADEFFLFADGQPYTTVLKGDLVRIVDCLLQVLTLIPEIGDCLKGLVVELVRYILCLVDWAWRLLVGLLSLPYFLIELPGVENFATRPNEWLDTFVAINDALIAETPTSFLNCLCTVLNKGFPVPPIPCGSCVVGGFIPAARAPPLRDPAGRLYEPWQLAGLQEPTPNLMRLTPLLRYGNSTSKRLGAVRVGTMAWARLGSLKGEELPSLAKINAMLDRRERELMRHWAAKKECGTLASTERSLREKEPKRWLFEQRLGAWDSLQNGQCAPYDTWMPNYNVTKDGDFSSQVLPERWVTDHNGVRLTLEPTIPPIASCNPAPPCFDLCCEFRGWIVGIVHALQVAARIVNGLALFKGTDQGTPNDFPYFTGELCDIGKPCLETDVVLLIRDTTQLFRCICQRLNLVIPVTFSGRPDMCCAIQRAGELLACAVQIIFNSVYALALGNTTAPPYAYFVTDMFIQDVNVAFDVTSALLDCICVFVRAVFPGNFFPGFQEATGFDPCCAVLAVGRSLIAAGRLVLNVIITLATITTSSSSFCYWRVDTTAGCGGLVSTLPFVVHVDAIITALFTRKDSQCLRVCGKDQGQSGLANCVCQLVNTLLPARTNPALPVSCDPASPNCVTFDFCCIFVRISALLGDTSKVLVRLFASLWQPWFTVGGIPTYPDFFVNGFFCDETVPAIGAPQCGCGAFECVKTNPLVDQLVDIWGVCMCEFFRLADDVIALTFDALGPPFAGSWGNCFCDTDRGIIPGLRQFVRAVLRTAVNFARRITDPTFWKPNLVISDVTDTWAFQVFGPAADGLCIAVGNLMCFFNSLFLLPPECLVFGQRALGGIVRWGFEVLLRILAFVEGFVSIWINEPTNSCTSGSCGAASGQVFGINAEALASVLTAMLLIPIDALIADGNVVCDRFCPPAYTGTCQCWDELHGVPRKPYQLVAAGPFCYAANAVVAPECMPSGCLCHSFSHVLVAGSCYDFQFVEQVCTADCTGIPCKNYKLPTCAEHPDTPPEVALNYAQPLDGIFMGLLRYAQCAARGGGIVLTPLIKLLSIIWQIFGAITRLGAAGLVFLFSIFTTLAPGSECGCWDYTSNAFNATVSFAKCGGLCYECKSSPCTCDPPSNTVFPGNPKVVCGFKQFLDAAGDFIAALTAVFTQQIITRRRTADEPLAPNDPGLPRFRERRRQSALERQRMMDAERSASNTSFVEQFLYTMYEFDTEDCFTDPKACICRNFDLRPTCEWDPEQQAVTPPEVTFEQASEKLAERFPWTSVCDNMVRGCAGMSWASMPDAEKAQYVKCIEKRIRGERMNSAWPVMPADYFYTVDGPYRMIHGIMQRATRWVADSFQERVEKAAEQRARFDERWPRFSERLEDRARLVRTKLLTQMHPSSPMFEATVQMDTLLFKWDQGYYHDLVDRAATKLLVDGITLPSVGDSLRELSSSAKEFVKTVANQPYVELARDTRTAFTEGARMASRYWRYGRIGEKEEKKEPKTPPPPTKTPKLDALRAAWAHSPIRKWFAGEYVQSGPQESLWTRWAAHLRRTIEFQRSLWRARRERDPEQLPPDYGLWTADLRLGTLREAWVSGFQPRWTPEKSANWDALRRLAYRGYALMRPDVSLPRDIQERFIFACNCVFADRALAVTIEVVDYCANDWVPNLAIMRDSAAESYLNSTAPYRQRSFHSRYRGRITYESSRDPDAWSRPKVIPAVDGEQKRTPFRGKRAYQWARASLPPAPGAFDLIEYVLCLLEDWFGSPISTELQMFFDDVVAWFTNPSTDVADYPNVGGAYWLTFFFRCEWPEYLNCSLGIGLESALAYALAIYAGVFLVLALFVPSTLTFLITFGTFFTFVIAVPAAAWHYSPQCWLMTPSAPIGFGFNVPVWPIPVSIALPMCALDEFVALLDKWIVPCYDFLIKACLVNGPVCPPPGERIDFVNCRAVGMADGIQHILFLLNRWWPGFCDFAVWLATTCLGMLWPGLDAYLTATLDGYKMASDTQQCRLEWCFWPTFPAIFGPLTVVFVVGVVLGFVVLAVVGLASAAWSLFEASPLYAAVPGGDQRWFETPMDTEGAEAVTIDARVDPWAQRRRENAQIQRRRPLAQRVGMWLMRYVFPKPHQE